MKIVGIIPARYESTRFPAKLLQPLMNKRILSWVIEYSIKANVFDDIIVSTDDEKIKNFVEEKYRDIKAVMTKEEAKSGSHRAFLTYFQENLDHDFLVSIPADEALINYFELKNAIEEIIQNYPRYAITTLYTKFFSVGDLISLKSCKIVNYGKKALYFSRSIIPAMKNGKIDNSLSIYKKHVGVFIFHKNILSNRMWRKQSILAEVEGLEQNGFLENGYEIFLKEIKHNYFGIDTKDQIELLEKRYIQLQKDRGNYDT